MAKNFSFRSLFVPATPRSKALRGKAGTVVVNNQSAGVPNTPATTVVNNYNITNNYTQEGGGVQVIRITIADLLALTPDQIQVSDIYAVHSSGSDESGWSKDEEFELYGKKYPDGSYAQYVDGVWLIADKDVVKTENEAIFNPLQKVVSLISKTYSQSSYDNLPGRVKAGIPIAEVRNYELDEAGVYQEKKESQTGSQSAETNVKTLVVPYARSYNQGGEMVYEGGALTPSDYERLCKGGSGNVDDVQVNGASVVDNKVAKIDLSNYVQKEDLIGYATQSWVSANFADKIWVNSQGFLKADDVKKFASTEFVYISVTNNGSSYDFVVEDKSFATAIVRDDSTRYTLKLELGFSNLTSAREFLRDYRVSVTQTNSTVQFPDSASVVTVDFLGLHIWLEINMTQGAVDPDPTAWYGIQFTKLNNIQR